MPTRPLEPAHAEPAATRSALERADLRLSPQDRLGTEARRWRHRLLPLHGLEGAAPFRSLAAAAPAAGAGQPLRVALSRRPPPPGHLPLRALSAARTPPHRRSFPAVRATGCDPETRVGYDHVHAGRRRPLPAGLRRDPVRDQARGNRDRVSRAGARLLRRPRHQGPKRVMTDNAFHLRAQPRASASCSPGNGIRHLTTQPYRPRTNGKVERFHQTMARESACGLSTDPTANGPAPCHTGSSTTTPADPTAHSETGPRSAAFTTSVGRTAS